MRWPWLLGALSAAGFWASAAAAGPDAATMQWALPYDREQQMAVTSSANDCGGSRCFLEVYSAGKVNALIQHVQDARERDKVAILAAIAAAPDATTIGLKREIDALKQEVQALRQELSEAQRAMAVLVTETR